MKIGILTQPLHTNYGGLLQAYALQTVLKRMGHDAWVVRFCRHIEFRTLELLKLRLKGKIARIVSRLKGKRVHPILTNQQKKIISEHTSHFIDKYINPQTEVVYSGRMLRRICNNAGFGAFVVGSDQVWRPDYSPKISHFFLDFVEGKKAKRISYAASFGVEDWRFSKRDTEVCKPLAQNFDAISVREDSAVDMCKGYLGVDAQHVLDPTMLLEKEDYIDLIKEENESKRDGNMFCYILDASRANKELIKEVSLKMSLTPFYTMPEQITEEALRGDINRLTYPPVTAWLRSFMDAEYVLTDSFHGCVFSIIFNKPFVALGNKGRGNARFDSLLKMYGLGGRLYDCSKPICDVLSAPINWDDVNRKRKQWQEKSVQFITQNLK